MDYDSIDAFVEKTRAKLAKGPTAIVVVEDPVAVAATLAHALELGFGLVVALMPRELPLPVQFAASVHRIAHDVYADDAVPEAVNRIAAAAPGAWFHYCYNAEFLFFPFCESRTIRDLVTFHTEERRDAMLTYVIDLYSADLTRHPDAVSLDDAMLDRSGYYALGRPDPANHNHPRERQLDFFGGLRWRFEEHVPPAKRRIDRIGIFRAQPGLKLLSNHTFNIEEYNTYACPWHNNLTAAICSFRTAKALRTNPGSKYDIETFRWRNSEPFEWHSQQLMSLGLMEPGQWF
ncbi:hypothetical protein [Ruixingdingia sedimenti]|uniref:Uncharacterized protein n=1 Tax=Ruixingdingia sedimenti TaxID=3073604 RepID=A0ABU1F8K8_9RHOB|nr:hypothetical protein [Xinfangfangia sp. LG-4]MDR5652794.1 hypothetical protein [Xinfangfangia sp. LG-4]